MPALANDRHELFCQEYATDLNGTRAGQAAGFKGSYGRQLLRRSDVGRRVEELVKERMREANLTGERILEETVRLAYADVTDVVTWTEDGQLSWKGSDQLPKDVTAAVKKVRVREVYTKDGDLVRTIEFEMHGKEGPIRMLHDYAGLAAPQKFKGTHLVGQVGITGEKNGKVAVPDVTGLTIEEWERIALEHLAKVEAVKAAALPPPEEKEEHFG